MRKLRQIEAALGRIENGRYGYCMESGDEIPKERLEAIPYALYTVACQAEIERQSVAAPDKGYSHGAI
jgi:DnaK suppressor protein